MVVVKNMKPPKSCAECPIIYKDDVDYRICAIIGKNIEGNPDEVRPDCPIINRLTNEEWIDFLSEQFNISKTSAKEMLHVIMSVKREYKG